MEEKVIQSLEDMALEVETRMVAFTASMTQRKADDAAALARKTSREASLAAAAAALAEAKMRAVLAAAAAEAAEAAAADAARAAETANKRSADTTRKFALRTGLASAVVARREAEMGGAAASLLARVVKSLNRPTMSPRTGLASTVMRFRQVALPRFGSTDSFTAPASAHGSPTKSE